MLKEMPDAGVFVDLIPILIDDSVRSTVRQWHMLEAEKEEYTEGTTEMTESEESESESKESESVSDDGGTDGGNRTENNDGTIRSQGQSKRFEEKLDIVKITHSVNFAAKANILLASIICIWRVVY